MPSRSRSREKRPNPGHGRAVPKSSLRTKALEKERERDEVWVDGFCWGYHDAKAKVQRKYKRGKEGRRRRRRSRKGGSKKRQAGSRTQLRHIWSIKRQSTTKGSTSNTSTEGSRRCGAEEHWRNRQQCMGAIGSRPWAKILAAASRQRDSQAASACQAEPSPPVASAKRKTAPPSPPGGAAARWP